MTTQSGDRLRRRPPAEVDGAVFGDLIAAANAAFRRGDVAALDRAYVAASAAARQTRIEPRFAEEHVHRLLALDRPSHALGRCAEYLAGHTGPDWRFVRLSRAEAYCAVGGFGNAAEDAAGVRAAGSALLSDLDEGRVCRVEGLVAAGRDDNHRARERLAMAHRLFVEIGAQDWAGTVAAERQLLAVRAGDESAIVAVLAREPPTTPAGHVVLAAALRARQHYERAYDRLVVLDRSDVDIGQRLSIRAELVTLLRLLRREDEANELEVRTAQLAVTLPDRLRDELLARMSLDVEQHVPLAVGPAIAHARRLIIAGRLVDAERVLADVAPRLASDADIAAWWLGTGELSFSWFQWRGGEPQLRIAIGQLRRAVAVAATPALVEGRIVALRVLGRAYFRLAEDARAGVCWSAAHSLEEQVAAAACENTESGDRGRLRMLSAASDEHDERVRAAAETAERLSAAAGPTGVACVVVAIEAARGSTVLAAVSGDPGSAARDLPMLSDVDGSRRWVADIAATLPEDQLVWLLYAAPSAVHHVLVGRDVLHHTATSCSRDAVLNAIENHIATVDPRTLEAAVRGGEFDACLAKIGALLGVSSVVSSIPERITRIAVAAAGELSQVPLAAVPIGGIELLGHRFALSDLPCLAALGPLRERSARQRGGRRLYVSPSDGFARTRRRGFGHRRLVDDEATPDLLRDRVARLHPHRIRIDCHGAFDSATDEPWLQLAPAGPSGRLTPDLVRALALDRCGTIILGACDSGMAQLRGRAEPDGFVRAALYAGSASAVAARWPADDPVAVAVLDRFEHHLRQLPRDVALHRAQQDYCAAATDAPLAAHPARWACWTLYGDTGRQTAAGRWRRGLDGRRDRCAATCRTIWRTVVTHIPRRR